MLFMQVHTMAIYKQWGIPELNELIDNPNKRAVYGAKAYKHTRGTSAYEKAYLAHSKVHITRELVTSTIVL
jgi:hypothetical protein